MIRPMTLHGIPVVIAEPIKCKKLVRRTWREQLFSWTPWEFYRTEYTFVDILEDGQIIKSDKTMIMTIATWKQVEHAMQQANPFEPE